MSEAARPADAAAATLGLGTLRQLAWVVADIEAAMTHWSRVLGVGPWFHKPRVALTQFRYFGREAGLDQLPELAFAFANSGALQLELIQPLNDVPSLFTDQLRQRGPGMQHVAFWTERYDEQVAQMLAAGYREGHAGRIGNRGRFAYFVHEATPGDVVEISEQSGGKAEFFRQIREAAIGWDGRDPVRVVP